MDDDFEWGDDPFSGDLDFDMDFDNPNKGGKLKSFISGFVGGVVGKTVGDSDARLKTLERVLPDTWGRTFTNINNFSRYASEAIVRIKSSSHDAVVDLQAISGTLARKFPEGDPNKIRDILISFSDKDFSGWEEGTSSDSDSLSMEDVEDDDIVNLIETVTASGILDRENDNRNTNKTIAMMSQIGGRQQGALNQSAIYLSRQNVILESLLEHQIKTKAKADSLQLSVAARSYLADIKYYKFMEKAMHRSVSELKEIHKYSKMSDYEKTSHSQAFRKSVRESIYTTVTDKAKGLLGLLEDKLSKDSLGEVGGRASMMTSMLRMGIEMSEGMPVNIPEMLGGIAGGLAVDNFDKLIKTERAQNWIKELRKSNPELAEKYDSLYKLVEDYGNVASYGTDNFDEIVNNLVKNKGYFDDDDSEFDTYEEYVQSLDPDVTPISKVRWHLNKTGKRLANRTLGYLTDNMEETDGSRISIATRRTRDNFENHYWTRQSDRTLNEIIPGWLSQLHLSLEKIRTGNNEIEALKYDYVNAKFITDSENREQVAKKLFNPSDYKYHVSSVERAIALMDRDNLLTPKAKKELTLALMEDLDKGLGVNPYNYLGTNLEDSDRFSASTKRELESLFKGAFSITDEDVTTYQEGSHLDRLKSSAMPTSDSKELLRKVAEETKGVRDFFPRINETLDDLRQTDYKALLESGIINKTEHGTDTFNNELIWDIVKEVIEQPDIKELDIINRLVNKLRPTEAPTSDFSLGFRTSSRLPQETTITPPEDSTGALKDVVEELTKLNLGFKDLTTSLDPLSTLSTIKFPDNTPLFEKVDKTNDLLANMLELSNVRNDVLTKILERQPTAVGKVVTPEEQSVMEEGKKSLVDKLKSLSIPNLFNKGVDVLLDNEPLILGGLLGGLAGVAFYNPQAAMLIGGGMAAMTAYGKISELAKARDPLDSEDLYEEDSTIPLLEARLLREGDYYCLVKNKIIRSYKEITGAIKVLSKDVVIGVQKLSSRLFTRENKEVFLSGLDAARKFLTNIYKTIDPLGRLKWAKDKAATRFFQMDVYKEGEQDPTLIGKRFATDSYYKRDESGNLVVIKGWNEIDGAVYDREGNALITREEYEAGLRTSLGVSINKLQDRVKSLGRFGLDTFNRVREKVTPYAKKAGEAIGRGLDFNFAPVVSSVDRIYDLLAFHWGYSTGGLAFEGDVPQEAIDRRNENVENTNKPTSVTNKLKEVVSGRSLDPLAETRLNSLEYQRQKKQEERGERLVTALEELANPTLEEGEEGEKKGFLGMMRNMFSGLLDIGKNTFGILGRMFPIITTIGSFALSGLKLLPAILSGIIGVSTAIYRTAGRAIDLLPGGRRVKNFAKGAGLAAAGYGVGLANDYLQESGLIEEDGLASKALKVGEYGAYAAGIATSLGYGGAITSGAGAVGSALLTGAAAMGTGALAVLTSPITLTALAVGTVGYLGYKAYTKGKGKQLDIRMAKYGLGSIKGDLADKFLQVEALSSKYVVVRNGTAAFTSNYPANKVLEIFNVNPDPSVGELRVEDVSAWLTRRFKPVYLAYYSLLEKHKFNSMEEFDKSNSNRVLNLVEEAHKSILEQHPLPYDMTPLLDKSNPLMNRQQTVVKVRALMLELKRWVKEDRKDKETKVADVVATSTVIETRGYLEKEADRLEKEREQAIEEGDLNKEVALNKQIRTNARKLSKMSVGNDFARIVEDTTIDVKDLLPVDSPIDPLTALRLSCYGNDTDTAWRVEAVLRLERYLEQNTVGRGFSQVRVKETPEEIFEKFKREFRVDTPSNPWYSSGNYDWFDWYKNRFLPVFMRYITLVEYSYTRSKPYLSWKRLTHANRYELGRLLVNTRVIPKDEDKEFSIWDIDSSPFVGTRSTKSKKEVTKILAHLESKSSEEKIIKASLEHKRLNYEQDIELKEQEIRENKERIETTTTTTTTNTPARTSTKTPSTRHVPNYSSRSLYSSPTAYSDPASNSDPASSGGVDGLVEGDIKINPGDDRGISIPKGTALKLIVKHATEAGITDPKELAFMAANADHETQGFKGLPRIPNIPPHKDYLRYSRLKYAPGKEQSN